MALTQNEAAPAADTASAGLPPGDTLSGFCAALRPLPTCGGQPLRELRWTPTPNELNPACAVRPGVSRPWLSSFRKRIIECRTKREVGIGRGQLRSWR